MISQIKIKYYLNLILICSLVFILVFCKFSSIGKIFSYFVTCFRSFCFPSIKYIIFVSYRSRNGYTGFLKSLAYHRIIGKGFLRNTSYLKLSALASTTDVAATSGAQAGLTDAVEIGESAVFYLDDAGYVVYVDEVTSTTNYLVVTDAAVSGDFEDSVIAKVILSDGTSATVTVSKLGDDDVVKTDSGDNEIAASAAKATLTGAAKTQVYSYTVNSDGEYELKTVTTVTATGITNNKPTVASGLIANTTTPIIVKDSGSSATLYTGINAVPSRTSATVLGVADSTTNVAKVIKTGMGLLGIEVPDRM